MQEQEQERQSGLAAEALAALSAPFPKSVIKSFKGRGGKMMRYIDVDVLEARIASVDPNWGKDVIPGAESVVVHYTILGVRRGDLFDNDDESNPYGAPQVNALARASRRAAKLFGVGKELWEEEEADEKPATTPRGGGKPVATEAIGPSAAQVRFLKNLGVAAAEENKYPPVSRAGGYDSPLSKLIDELKKKQDDRDYDPEEIVRRHVKSTGAKKRVVEEDADDDDFSS